MADNRRIVKICLGGGKNVGKTSICNMFDTGEFTTQHGVVDFRIKRILHDIEPMELQACDFVGRDGIRSFGRLYLRHAHGIIIVYDLTDETRTPLDLPMWYEQATRICPAVPYMIVGNKRDLVADDEVPTPAQIFAEDYAKQHGIPHCIVSAKNKAAIDQLFDTMLKSAMAHDGDAKLKKISVASTSDTLDTAQQSSLVDDDNGDAKLEGRHTAKTRDNDTHDKGLYDKDADWAECTLL
eukprot:TRINITY_DN8055_c0_g2_i3.p1 TRINITY_DN8055_c0_g2~~TRINITY_DN8055_c0_g2_i3.p1  ORF type:complete len:239 (+),score=41.50 TRINITY_DN8055_c0_g2_i3:59-775(+)